MHCRDVKSRLVDWLYGEQSPEDRRAIESHLAQCEACRQQARELEHGRNLLDRAPKLRLRIEFAALYRQAAAQAERSRRRWRLGTFATCAALGCVIVSAATQLRFKWQPTRFVVASGSSIGMDQAERSLRDTASMLVSHSQRLDDLDVLARLIVTEVKTAERTHEVRLAELQRDLEELRRDSAIRWAALSEGVRGLYLARIEPDRAIRSGIHQ